MVLALMSKRENMVNVVHGIMEFAFDVKKRSIWSSLSMAKHDIVIEREYRICCVIDVKGGQYSHHYQ
jgi:hypothetical protein